MKDKREGSKLIRITTETERLLNNFRASKGDEPKPSFNDAIVKLWNDRNDFASRLNRIRKEVPHETDKTTI